MGGSGKCWEKVCVSTWLDGKRWKQGRELWKGELSHCEGGAANLREAVELDLPSK